tara:strand:- start:3710 stop:3961 length:252 start_codon:yes stop_codon:yes gene_type:complete
MNFLKITENGTTNFKLDKFDRAAIYLEGTDGGATFELICHGVSLGTLDASTPLLTTFGSGAPLKLVTTGGTSVDVTLHAYPVE